jgi:hypothetical protein
MCKFACIAFLIASTAAQLSPAQSKPERVAADPCQDITAWLRAHPAGPADFRDYGADLMRRGMTAAQASARIKALPWENCPSAVDLAFDRIYRSEKLNFNAEPNAFLVETTREMTPGTALDVAMGQGRNSICLAKAGWRVTGFDVSREGLAVARKAAKQAGVKIEMIQQGWQDFDFGTEKWDLILLIYAWVPISDSMFVQRLCLSLRQGGSIVYEGYRAEPASSSDIWPKSNELITLFQNALRILRYEDIESLSDWRRQTKTHVLRMLARK